LPHIISIYPFTISPKYNERHYLKAAEIIRDFGKEEGIRTLDSLQLVAALDVHDTKFISADKFLSGLAIKMGLSTITL